MDDFIQLMVAILRPVIEKKGPVDEATFKDFCAFQAGLISGELVRNGFTRDQVEAAAKRSLDSLLVENEYSTTVFRAAAKCTMLNVLGGKSTTHLKVRAEIAKQFGLQPVDLELAMALARKKLEYQGHIPEPLMPHIAVIAIGKSVAHDDCLHCQAESQGFKKHELN